MHDSIESYVFSSIQYYKPAVGSLAYLKFGFSEKATKFEKIFVLHLTRASYSVRATAYLSKSRGRFLKTNVDKSYYTNFTTFLWLDEKNTFH